MAKHVQSPAAFPVGVAIEFAGIVEVVADDGLVKEIGVAKPAASTFPAFVVGLVLSVMRLGPHKFHKGGKALVEPDVAPVFASDQVSEPLVAKLVRDKAVLVGVEFGCGFGMIKGAAGICGGAGILHTAGNEVIDHDLRVFFPGIIHAKLFAEEIDHGGSAAVIYRKTITAAFRGVVSDRHAVPGVFCFVKFTGDNGDEIGRAGNGFPPSPSLQTFACFGNANELAVGNGDPGSWNSKDSFRSQTIVGIVVGRKIVARVFGFTLRPDLLGAIGVIFVGKNEVHAFGGLAFITNRDVELVSYFSCPRKRDDKFLSHGFKFHSGFIDSDTLDRETNGIEGNFGSAVAENREGVCHIAKNLFLIGGEAQSDAGVLQVVVARAGVRLVGANLQCATEN